MSRSNVDKSQIIETVITGADGKTEQSVTVPAKLAQEAVSIFDAALAQYPTIKAHEDALKVLREGPASLGNSLLKLSQDCIRHANRNIGQAASLFAGACKFAEMEALRKVDPDGKKKVTVAKILPSWANAKSVVLNSLRKGHDHTATTKETATVDGVEVKAGTPSFPSITSVRKALAGTRGTGGNAAEGNTDADKLLGEFKSIAHKATVPMRAALANLARTLGNISEADYPAAAQLIVEMSTEIKEAAQSRAAGENAEAEMPQGKAAQMRGGTR